MDKKQIFAVSDRERLSKKASNHLYDVIIIGGGITGAGIALDASSRGMSCLLLEKEDFASGTSSKSTKLIHGGLRYLKQLEFGLVRESGQERAIVHKLAPHLVHPEKMLLPIVTNGTFSKWSASLAISVYDLLARVDSKDKKKSLSKEETLEREPMLRNDILKGGIEYSEYRTDDARLTIENIKTAHRYGADTFNYCKVDELLYENEMACGVKAFDYVLNREVEYKAKHIVSAAGPWVDVLRSKDKSLIGNKLRLTKGVHLVFDNAKLPVNQSIYFDAFDGRMLFAIPRGRVTYVGTSDTDYDGDKNNVVCTKEDTDYILAAVNNYFDFTHLNREDVISSWAGLRPLIQEEGKSPSELSRKDEIFVSHTGFISIAGGKLTGYRKMAQRIVDLLQQRDEHLPQHKCHTDKIALSVDAFKNYTEVRRYVKDVENQILSLGGEKYMAMYLVSTYGKSVSMILEQIDRGSGVSFGQALIKSEINFCYKYESIYKPEDFFNRRTGMLYFDPSRLEENFAYIMDCYKDIFEWTQEEFDKIMTDSKALIKQAVLR